MRRCLYHSLRSALGVCLWLVAVALTGCGDRLGTETGASQAPIVKPTAALQELEAKCGVRFPSNTEILHASDGGGRDQSYGFYTWALFAPTSITLPKAKEMGAKGYFPVSLDTAVRMVEVRIQRRRIPHPTSALATEWENAGYIFRGTLVHTDRRDYVVINQFRKR